MTIALPSGPGVRVWLATGYTDMRCGFPSLALRVQEVLQCDPFAGHLFVFRGRSGSLVKAIWHDGQGAVFLRKGLSAASLSGRRLRRASSRYRLRN